MKRSHLLLALLGLLAVWQLLALLLRTPLLPGPLRVAAALGEEAAQGELPRHSLASFWRVLAGMLLSVALAAPAGMALGLSKKANEFFSPLIYVLYPIPKVVFVPLLMLFFGVGDLSKILMIFVILFFQILVLVRDQAAQIRPELVNSVRSLGAGRRALFATVYVPASLPAVLTALRQSIGTAVAVLYIAEVFATRWGLGYYIYFQGTTLLNYPAMYAGVAVMSLLGVGMYLSVDWLEKRLCPWL